MAHDPAESAPVVAASAAESPHVLVGTLLPGILCGLIAAAALLLRRMSGLAKDSMVLVVGAGQPWASRRQVVAADLANSEWVLREKGSGTRSVFEAAVRKAGLSPDSLRVTMELPSNDAVRAAVEAGMGATVISASVVASAIESGLLHRVKLDLPERAFYVLRHRERAHGRAAEALLSLAAGSRARTKRRPAAK